jgi:DNA methylase
MPVRDRILELRRVKAGDLAPHESNPRLHPEAQRRAVEGSLATLGQVAPLLAYREGDRLKLFDGHLRSSIDPEAQVTVAVTDLSPAEARQALATLDRSAALADTDEALLSDLLRQVREDAAAGVLAADARLDGLLADLTRPTLLTDPDALPEQVPPRAKRGDVWLCGAHRVMCGDATCGEDVARLMDGEPAAILLGDPPYGIGYVGLDGPKMPGMLRRRVEPIAGDDGPFDPMPAVELASCSEVFLWGGDCFYDRLPPGGSWLVWDKRASDAADAIPGAPFEMCWSKKRHAREFIRVAWGGWYSREPGDAERYHPAQKPVTVMVRVMEIAQGDVYDPFLGSGTTMIAAEQLGRRCYGMEIEPRYVDVALARWEAATGRQATRIDATDA